MQNSANQDDVVQGATDSELEQMLDDAYQVPALPRSLLKRIDRAVEQEWGVSPQLSWRKRSRLVRAVAHGSRHGRFWSIAASLVVIAASVLVFQSNGHAYGWAKMIEALGRAELVEISGADDATVRWMSVAKAIVGERSASKSRVLDFGHGIVLDHGAGAQQVERRSLRAAKGMSQPEAVVIAFLLNNVSAEGNSFRQSDLRVLNERCSAAGEEVQLEVVLGSARERVNLSILLDRETHLPRSFGIAGNPTASPTGLNYLDADADQRLAQSFPANLPIVDAAPAAAAIAGDEPRIGPETAPNAVAVADVIAPQDGTFTAAPLVGAASLQWQAVKPADWSGDEAVTRINAILATLWKEHGIEPAPLASDEELLRRVYLDLAGRTPSVAEVRAYLDDKSPERYARLVDQLLSSRDHTTHLATMWRTYLIPEGIDLSRFGGPESFEKWIGEQFAAGVPYDEVVRRLLLAEGRLSESGPLLFYAAVKLDPDQLAARSARVFLGMRLECAQCHDDHFEPWLQEDFWSYAAFFARISRPQGVLNNVSTVMRVRDIDRGEVKLPDSEEVVLPQFLDGSPIDNAPRSVARRQQLARWLTADDNPFFARATANRVWGQLFGKGIVDPVDGFGKQHQPVSQELLDELAARFLASDYDLREMFRAIVLSRAYRLSSGAEKVDPKRIELFAQMNVKLLTAEQMYDCITVASMLGSAESGEGFNLDRVGNTSREQFLRQFRVPPGRVTEYQAGIPQALTLMNGGLIADATGLASSGLLKTLEVPLITNKERVEILYLATLSRRPTPSEQEMLEEYIDDDLSGPELYESLADVLWALLNSAEFTMIH